MDDLYTMLSKFQHDFLAFRQEMNVFRVEMNTFRKETQNVLGKQSQALIDIESTLNFYGDMYKINKDGINSLDKRITILETK